MDLFRDRTLEKVEKARGRADAGLVLKAAERVRADCRRAAGKGMGHEASVYEEEFVLLSESLYRLFQEEDPRLVRICGELAGDWKGTEPDSTAQLHARHLLVLALLTEGRGQEGLEEAEVLRDSLEGFGSLYPDVLLRAEHDLARCLMAAGRAGEAVGVYEESVRRLRLSGNYEEMALGITLLRLSRAHRQAGEPGKADQVISGARRRLVRLLGGELGVRAVNCYLQDTSL